ncbi:hypothetical protein OG866_00135 [Streptomyces sp. NBC_00663]|uniref:hypothetical protein n=1 Tax=Streptomyces sp. NBC_00663 TaxID=2975801 RepID=UPI002E334CCC|nr:hypothetical protein [Streptomyces sp. NBC_00663]
MSSVVLRNEADARFDGLAARLERIAHEVASVVELCTGLPLPDQVCIRTMTVPAWMRTHRDSAEQQFHAEAAQLSPSRTGMREARELRQTRLREVRLLWPTVGGQAVKWEPGQPDVVVLPAALTQAGRLHDDPFLYKVLAHEMTRIAQYAASSGTLWAAQRTFFPHLRGVRGWDYPFLAEGHAHEADQRITTKLLGHPVPANTPSPYATVRYRNLWANPQRQALATHHLNGAEAVARIINTQGLDAFNRVWTTPALAPLCAETHGEPAAWQARFATLTTKGAS